jgi:hypothetical protein
MSIFQRLYNRSISRCRASSTPALTCGLAMPSTASWHKARSRRGPRSKLGCATKRWRISRTVNLHKMSCKRRRRLRGGWAGPVFYRGVESRSGQQEVVYAGQVLAKVRTRGIVPAVDTVRVVGHEPYS